MHQYVIYISIFSNMYALRYISMMIELALYSDRRYVHCTKTYYVWGQSHFECAYHIFPQNMFATSTYRGSPTSTVSSSTISTSTVFQCYVLKTVLVEFLCTKNRTSGNWLCSTHQYEIRIVQFFPSPKNRTNLEIQLAKN